MIAAVTVLLALPIGWLVRSRSLALALYAIAFGWAFTYQSVYLLVDMVDGGRTAFTPGRFPWSYGVVSLAILLAGCGLVVLGQRLAARRRAPLVAS